MKPLRLSLPTAILWLAAPLAAQSVTALRADRHELATMERLGVRFDRERGGVLEQAAWPGEFEWFLVRVAGGQTNRQSLISPQLLLSESGVTLLAADRKPRIEEVTPRELRTFFRSRVGPATLPGVSLGRGGEQGLRVRRLESSKLLVRVVGEEGWLSNSATAQSKTGQRVEIRPMGDPTSVKVRTDMPLRIYVPNPEKAGTKVIARNLASGKRQTFLTDRVGTGYFTVDQPGVWLVETHHARRLFDDPEADWEIHTATLTFEVPSWDPRELEDR
jgi:hypothetical protein